jgi:hypothetical protein
MKLLTAIVLGMLSGILTALSIASLLQAPNEGNDLVSSVGNLLFMIVAFAVGWTVSTLWMLQQARALSVVFRRGFVLGAAEWLAFIPLNLFSQARLAASHSGPLSNGGAIGLGLAAIVGVGFSVGMSILCLICFAVAYFIGRETDGNAATKQCPLCAETIKEAARKCRFCGADLPPVLSPSRSIQKDGRQTEQQVSVGKVLLVIGALSCAFVAVAIWSVWWQAEQSHRPKVVMTPEAQRKYSEDVRKLIEEQRRKP